MDWFKAYYIDWEFFYDGWIELACEIPCAFSNGETWPVREYANE